MPGIPKRLPVTMAAHTTDQEEQEEHDPQHAAHKQEEEAIRFFQKVQRFLAVDEHLAPLRFRVLLRNRPVLKGTEAARQRKPLFQLLRNI